jgi:HSP20 family protein
MLTLFQNDPTWSLFGQLDRQMDRVMRELARPTIRADYFGPQVHVWESDEGVKLVAEVPGLGSDDIEIAATPDTLTLKAERKVATPEGKQVLRRERRDVTFDATYRFEHEIDPDKISAKVENGLLTLTAPRAPKVEPKRVTVQVR